MDISQIISCDTAISSLSADMSPVATVQPGQRVQIETTDRPYQSITTNDIDSGKVNFREINRLTGSIAVEGAMPGDALGFTIQHIEPGLVAHVPYISRWRFPAFPRERSSMRSFPIRSGRVNITEEIAIDVRPMVGCIATSPARGKLSSLSPAAATGGNLDIEHICAGATVWLPVEVPGALFAIGDVHASMGSNEPLGAGMECAGSITGIFHLAPGIKLSGPRIESDDRIHFVGTHRDNDATARQIALRAAWNWLIDECGLDEEATLAVCAGMLDVTLGGPAGRNYLASFDFRRLRTAGVSAPLLIEVVSQTF